MTGNSITISHPTGILEGTVLLPASKSESNRALIIQALGKEGITLHNLSDANDTVLLKKLLASTETEINAEDAGTVMRFLTAYFSLTNQTKILTGTERMCQRPIGILVDALRELGAEISYLKIEGFPPLKVSGFNPKPAKPARLKMRGDVSSQFISAILLAAPLLESGLFLELTSPVSSRPYIEMTLELIREFGIVVSFQDNIIQMEPGSYKGGHLSIESDWSAASYWYSTVFFAKEAEIFLSGLKENSLQGDKKVAEIMTQFGVNTTFQTDGILLSKIGYEVRKTAIDFSQIPDLAQTFAVLAAAKNIELEMTGLESLRIKETDRIAALQTELAKFNVQLLEIKPDVFQIQNGMQFSKRVRINTCHDHRMAMAFAPLGLLHEIEIVNPEVVKKSYPKFWTEMKNTGFAIASGNDVTAEGN